MAQTREKFKELAEKRVTRAIKDIRLISNLANRNNYRFEPQEAEKIVSTLEREVKMLRTKFTSSGDSTNGVFKL